MHSVNVVDDRDSRTILRCTLDVVPQAGDVLYHDGHKYLVLHRSIILSTGPSRDPIDVVVKVMK